MSDVTRILSQIESGDQSAAEELLPLVYDELRKLAAAKMASENPGQTLQATALVHDAFIRLVDVEKPQHWNSRGHFFGAAAQAMRRILVENSRRKRREKHGGGFHRVNLDVAATCAPSEEADDLIDLDEALTALNAVEPEKAAIVQLRYFAGLTLEEVAACRGISLATAKRHWVVARAWLYDAMSDKKNLKANRNS
ncbi:MAG: sigma-70 family RNA polymerase sigma factor [Pirellula sp.]